MKLGKTLAVSLTLVALLLTLVVTPVLGEVETQRDKRGDAVASADIVRARFTNGSARLGSVMRYRDLKDHGRSYLVFRQRTWFDSALLIKVRRDNRGNLSKGLFYSDNVGDTRLPCNDIRVEWRAARDVVRASIPQRCSEVYHKGTWLMWGASGGRSGDYTREVRVRRG